jgi:Fic family protein
MRSPQQKNCIISFQPHTFPPRNLHKKAFSTLLRKANLSLQKYHHLLSQSPSPLRLFSQLINREAIASVQSQKVQTTISDFLKFIHSKKERRNDKLLIVANYKEALVRASKEIPKSPISKELLCKIHQQIKRGAALKSDLGRYRNRQNWIGPEGCKIEEAYLYPPPHTNVDNLMGKLFSYAKTHQREPLLQLALFLAQLLFIHPFMDGNGRVARILIPLFLYQKNVIPIPFLFMSRYFFRHRLKYFQCLFKITEKNKWEPWIIFFLKGILSETNKDIRLLKKMMSLYNRIKQKNPRLNSKTLIFLFENPIFTHSAFSKAKGSKTLLKRLYDSNILRRDKDRMYYFPPLLEIIEYTAST